MKTFIMIRHKDETGTSGTGTILEGVVFSDGVCVVRWRGKTGQNSTAVWASFDDFKAIHIDAHPDNNTEIVWSDENPRD